MLYEPAPRTLQRYLIFKFDLCPQETFEVREMILSDVKSHLLIVLFIWRAITSILPRPGNSHICKNLPNLI